MKAARIIHDHHRTGWTPGNSVEEQEELERKELLETLDVLLREGDIDESFLDDTTNSPEARALHMKWELFKTHVSTILATHNR